MDALARSDNEDYKMPDDALTDEIVSIPKRKPGRPRVFDDMKKHRREYMREYRSLKRKERENARKVEEPEK